MASPRKLGLRLSELIMDGCLNLVAEKTGGGGWRERRRGERKRERMNE